MRSSVDIDKIGDNYLALQKAVGNEMEHDEEIVALGHDAFMFAMLYAALACAMYPALYERFKKQVETAPESFREES